MLSRARWERRYSSPKMYGSYVNMNSGQQVFYVSIIVLFFYLYTFHNLPLISFHFYIQSRSTINRIINEWQAIKDATETQTDLGFKLMGFKWKSIRKLSYSNFNSAAKR